MSTLKIGMFDSGIGGFSILKEVHRLLPYAEFHYIADDEFAPYGLKEKHEIIARSLHNCSILIERGVQLIVVACNSATAAAIDVLREQISIPLVGVEPYINILNHVEIKPEQISPKCAVITTELTGRSQKFISLKQRLDPQNLIEHFVMLKLATLIEHLYAGVPFEDIEPLINQELDPLKNRGFSYLILGCTHYPLLKDYIESYLQLKTVCPGPGVARQTKVLADKLKLIPSIDQSSFFFMQSTKCEWEILDISRTNQLYLSKKNH